MTGSTRHRFAGATSLAVLALLAAAAVGQPASATYPAPANGPIIFGVRSPDGHAELYSVTPDGTDMQQLTTLKGFNACPAASTDGTQVAFCSEETGNLEIWMMDADGSNPRQVTHTGGRVFFPDISPDGTKLVFEGTIGTDPTGQIWVSAIDGSGIVQLTAETSATGDASYPVWSPDGSKIAYIAIKDGLE